eukprot:CAMPEP_0195516008 /NCGR_PEP_ID=MMETSP0794_2-20130614/6878_1 /TAXON_ID=515487 /ORGANISM="Stephanopyxis turris, Strain CCMP 815" /LENGTH=945 /DNA_ID=CAMNT_0040644519 /DNA_START=317 /DNA_END=3154 /DNA_ORIENTATION=+
MTSQNQSFSLIDPHSNVEKTINGISNGFSHNSNRESIVNHSGAIGNEERNCILNGSLKSSPTSTAAFRNNKNTNRQLPSPDKFVIAPVVAPQCSGGDCVRSKINESEESSSSDAMYDSYQRKNSPTDNQLSPKSTSVAWQQLSVESPVQMIDDHFESNLSVISPIEKLGEDDSDDQWIPLSESNTSTSAAQQSESEKSSKYRKEGKSQAGNSSITDAEHVKQQGMFRLDTNDDYDKDKPNNFLSIDTLGISKRSSDSHSHHNGTQTPRFSNFSPLAVNDKIVESAAPPPPPIPPTSILNQNQPEEVGTTVHAQALVIGFAFAFVWSPQNLMAPNLTQMATTFDFDADQRDLFLGADIAFATAVLSLPVSGLIGFLSDIVTSRKYLYAGAVFMCGVSSICTGLSSTYSMLFACRFVTGGCMAGALPVAFSLLGDFFHTKDRNAASSALTICMGAGIVFGQAYSGKVGVSDAHGWRFPFYVCGGLTILSSFMVLLFVSDPIRGGKETLLQDMLKKTGRSYDRKLTLEGFYHAIWNNPSNFLLISQGFVCNVPWGIIMTFINDFLSQEAGLSVHSATNLVVVFGFGSGLGGILGGWGGQYTTALNVSYMPIFMAVTTFLGIFPFLGLLNTHFRGATLLPYFYSFSGGFIASSPCVNARPAIINVNPPETRGATLTAANLVINLARGTGPMMLTSLMSLAGITRQTSFNILLIVFWGITSILLLLLAKTLPLDQEKMEMELAKYVNGDGLGASPDDVCPSDEHHQHDASEHDALLRPSPFRVKHRAYQAATRTIQDNIDGDGESIVSIEDRITSFDGDAARESLVFMGEAIREIGGKLHRIGHHGNSFNEDTEERSSDGKCSVNCSPNLIFRKEVGKILSFNETDQEENSHENIIIASDDHAQSHVSLLDDDEDVMDDKGGHGGGKEGGGDDSGGGYFDMENPRDVVHL